MKAEKVQGTRKLIKMLIDIGGVQKQSLAGLADQYTADELVSRLVIVVTNLKPRKVFGLESEVMILAAIDGEKVSVLQPDKSVSAGSKVT